ncbi:MAG TPA: CoA transferase [Dehalococcoidia bacterium]|nr:CoA transferase [Dehalococcoidia bacterium]
MTQAPLAGLRVLEIGEFVSAAYCAKLLSDLGAEVLKLEPPDGDRARRYGPFRGGVPDPDASGLFLWLNHGKRLATLDLAAPDGRDAFHQLAAEADLVIENLEAAEIARAGAAYETLAKLQPGLIVTSISPFGRTGPRAHWRGHGLQAAAGSSVAYRTGDPARCPLTKPLNDPEFLGGVHAAAATLLALRQRERGGPGQHVDVAIQDVLFSVTSGTLLVAAIFGGRTPPSRSGHRYPAFFPWTVLPVADGFMEFVTMQDRQWQAFVDEIGSPAWASDPRFQNRVTMTQYADELDGLLLAAVGRRTRADLWEACRRRRISFQPVHRTDELLRADHLRQRGFFVPIPDGNGGSVTAPGSPFVFEGRRAAGHPAAAVREPAVAAHPPANPVRAAAAAWTGRAERRPPAADCSPTDAPLAGVRVLDLGQVWAGPLLGQYLSDFGADVIRVETGKRQGMMSGAAAVPTDPAAPASYNVLFRNRRSVSLDLEHPRGHALFLRLTAVSDVVFDNLSPRAVRKLGIGYEALRRVNPGIVVASLSAAGQHGPWADVLTYGPSLTALYGIKSLLGYPGDTRIMEDVADLDPTAATYALTAILAALRRRERSGQGTFIDLAQGEAGLASLGEAALEYAMNGVVLGPTGNRHRAMAPHGIYPSAGPGGSWSEAQGRASQTSDDAWISIAVDSDAAWRALCVVCAEEAHATDPRFATLAGRLRHVEALDALTASWTRRFDASELSERLQAAGVAAYPVQDPLAAVRDEQIAFRRTAVRVATGALDAAQVYTGTPWFLSEAPPTIYGPARPLGADNESVLRGVLGLSAAELTAAIAAGAVA